MLAYAHASAEPIDKRARNRASARESRNRRKAYMETLENRVAELEAEVTHLRTRVAELQALGASREAAGAKEVRSAWASPDFSAAGAEALLRDEYDEFVGRVRRVLVAPGPQASPTGPVSAAAPDDLYASDRGMRGTTVLPLLEDYHEHLSSCSSRRRRLVQDALRQLLRSLAPTVAEKFVVWMLQHPGALLNRASAPRAGEAGGARKRARSCEDEQTQFGEFGAPDGGRGPSGDSSIQGLLAGALELT